MTGGDINIVWISLTLTFVLLPLLVTWFTPLTYRQLLGSTRDVLITAFATGSVFVVLTVLSQRVCDLLESTGMEPEKARSRVDVIVPTAFSLPSAGTLLALGFVQFAAWASDAALSPAQQIQFAAVGPASFFRSSPTTGARSSAAGKRSAKWSRCASGRLRTRTSSKA